MDLETLIPEAVLGSRDAYTHLQVYHGVTNRHLAQRGAHVQEHVLLLDTPPRRTKAAAALRGCLEERGVDVGTYFVSLDEEAPAPEVQEVTPEEVPE